MGIHVILEIEPRAIEARAWASVYEETLALLEAWKPRLLGWGWRLVEGVEVPMYMRSIRCNENDPAKAYWSVVGDRESLQTAECQSLHRDIGHYLMPRDRSEVCADIIAFAADPKHEATNGPRGVFGNKTQGCPYHFAMLAAAMLVEERFPLHAMVWGDIDRGQALEAQRMAAPILGRELPLPVRVDAPRLIERLRRHFDRDALPAAFERVYLGESEDQHEAVLRAFPGEEGAELWKRALRRYKSPRSLGVIRLVIDWLNADRDLREACRFACLDPAGPRFSPEKFVDTLASTWIGIPRSVRELLSAFEKPEGASHTVDSLLGSMLLDMEAMGRHLRVSMEPERIEAGLSEVFGEQGPALFSRFRDKSAKKEKALAVRDDDVKSFLEDAGEQAEDQTEFLAVLPQPEDMGPRQKLWVRGMAWATMTALTRLRDQDAKLANMLRDAKKARKVLVRLLSKRAPALTEDAWDALLAEEDTEVLSFWVALLQLDANEIHASQVRRAFFENEGLRRHALELGHDPKEMRAIGEQVAKAGRETHNRT